MSAVLHRAAEAWRFWRQVRRVRAAADEEWLERLRAIRGEVHVPPQRDPSG